MPQRRTSSRFASMAAVLRREAGQMTPVIVFLLVVGPLAVFYGADSRLDDHR